MRSSCRVFKRWYAEMRAEAGSRGSYCSSRRLRSLDRQDAERFLFLLLSRAQPRPLDSADEINACHPLVTSGIHTAFWGEQPDVVSGFDNGVRYSPFATARRSFLPLVFVKIVPKVQLVLVRPINGAWFSLRRVSIKHENNVAVFSKDVF